MYLCLAIGKLIYGVDQKSICLTTYIAIAIDLGSGLQCLIYGKKNKSLLGVSLGRF